MMSEDLKRHSFSLRYRKGMAVLLVKPEGERTRPVYADDVAARMKILGIPPVPARRIREIIKRGNRQPEILTEWPAGAQLSAHVVINVSEDGMRAEAVVHAPRPGGAPMDKEILNSAMADAGISKGIDRKTVLFLLKTENAGVSKTLARGEPPVKGKSERTECLFITSRGKPWKELNSGKIDLKELNFIQNRKAGELLARNIPAVPSKDGYDVLGTVIDAETADTEILLSAGDGVVESEDGLAAEVDGNVRLVEGVVSIEPTINVKNVDYSTGNIDFDGSVSIEETVADGFTVRATGDIQVGKTIGRGYLDAGRNLVLIAGFAGDGEGSCKVRGNLYSKFLEGTRAEVSGDLIITEAILHSEIEINGNVILSEGRGEITGGTAALGGSLSCKRIGNVYSGVTRIYVGSPPGKLNAFFKLGGTLKVLQDEVDELDRQIDYLRSRSESDRQELRNLETGLAKRAKRLKEGAVELKEMRKNLEPAEGTFMAVQDRIFPGASLSFGLEGFPLGDKGLERVMLSRENGRIAVHGLKPGEEITFPAAADSASAPDP